MQKEVEKCLSDEMSCNKCKGCVCRGLPFVHIFSSDDNVAFGFLVGGRLVRKEPDMLASRVKLVRVLDFLPYGIGDDRCDIYARCSKEFNGLYSVKEISPFEGMVIILKATRDGALLDRLESEGFWQDGVFDCCGLAEKPFEKLRK